MNVSAMSKPAIRVIINAFLLGGQLGGSLRCGIERSRPIDSCLGFERGDAAPSENARTSRYLVPNARSTLPGRPPYWPYPEFTKTMPPTTVGAGPIRDA